MQKNELFDKYKGKNKGAKKNRAKVRGARNLMGLRYLEVFCKEKKSFFKIVERSGGKRSQQTHFVLSIVQNQGKSSINTFP